MVFTPILALAFVALTPIVNAYPVTGSVIDCHSGPGASHSVVKTYEERADIEIVCQATGTTVDGSDIWHQTVDDCYVSDFSSDVTEECPSEDTVDDEDTLSEGALSERSTSSNLPGLSATQTKHAKAIIAKAKKEGLGRQGCLAGISTALVESNILIYANKKVPASLKYHHDAVAEDYDSVGIFQQRAVYYPNIAADMDAAKSAAQFFKIMKKVSGWKKMNTGKLCQKVQGSAYPSRYQERVPESKKICSAGGL
ncbi:hypothetical protein DTO006G1_7245 [Penicillium roqueforti]|nr:hypothetical protein CBS147337_7804 [Penicillium roqueforti]KAI2696163.1 hypothetical protein CBS147372_8654 [Penicillium roqueforti]KAI2711558.1 hypothetical protein CBS147354_8254 [Penicillium roqueforti]KAI2757767.1 hypothetical protein DTO006G1_7245 [Penicillium roqueforti]KAI3146207.1 hypothetical protein CBS147317_9462 [Penicillium roqueforti]